MKGNAKSFLLTVENTGFTHLRSHSFQENIPRMHLNYHSILPVFQMDAFFFVLYHYMSCVMGKRAL